MADLSSLRAAIEKRAEDLVDTASADVERQLLVAAGDALPPGALSLGPVETNGDTVSVLVSADYAVTVWIWVHNHTPPNDFPPHLALDGVTFDENNWPEVLAAEPGQYPGGAFYVPGDHEGCFPAGTVVSGPVPSGATLRWYEGEMVELSFASGDLLTATPNHPVLTDQGWVPAGSLDERDRVVRCEGRDRISRLVPDHQQMPSPIEEVVRSVGERAGVVARRVPVAAEHFHGDGVGSEIAVEWTDRFLRDRLDTALGQPPGEQRLGRRHSHPAPLPRSGRPAESIHRVRPATLRVVRRGDDSPVLLGATTGGVDLLNGARIAEGFARLDQPGLDRLARHRVGGREIDHRLTGPVSLDDPRQRLEGATHVGRRPVTNRHAPGSEQTYHRRGGDTVLEADLLRGHLPHGVVLDDVVSVRRFPFRDHVHNLQTTPGWYIANGVVVHNCLCTIENVIGDKVFDYGQSDGGPIVIQAFGQDVLVAPPAGETTDEAPFWWRDVLSQETWNQALRDAQ